MSKREHQTRTTPVDPPSLWGLVKRAIAFSLAPRRISGPVGTGGNTTRSCINIQRNSVLIVSVSFKRHTFQFNCGSFQIKSNCEQAGGGFTGLHRASGKRLLQAAGLRGPAGSPASSSSTPLPGLCIFLLHVHKKY